MKFVAASEALHMLFPLTEILLSPIFKKYLNLKNTSLEVKALVAQLCPTLRHPMDCSPPGFSVRGNLQAKNTGVDCRSLLQGIFPTQGLNPSLLHCRQILYHLSHGGKLLFGKGLPNPQLRLKALRI